MTREEASNILDDYDVNFEGHTAEEIAKAFDVAFRALEQEPCEDVISRQFMKEMGATCIAKRNNENDLIPIIAIDALPSVTPQPKTGHWIEEIDDYGEVTGWHCDKCYEDSGFTTNCKWDFCPNCGRRMIDQQESEVSDADSN